MDGSNGDEGLSDSVEFRPGWPDIVLHGLIVARTTVTQLSPDSDVEFSDDAVEWTLHLGVRQGAPRFAMLGDLTVTNPFAFAGVTVAMPFALRDEPDDPDVETQDGILRQYGDWISAVMYDHAATVLRTALAGNGLPLSVPYGTPEVRLHTSDSKGDSDP